MDDVNLRIRPTVQRWGFAQCGLERRERMLALRSSVRKRIGQPYKRRGFFDIPLAAAETSRIGLVFDPPFWRALPLR